MKCWVPLPERFPGWRELGQCIWPLPQSSAEKPQQTVEAMGLRAVRRGLLGNSSLGCLYGELDVEESRWDVAWDTTKAVLSDFGIKQHFVMLSLCPSKNKGPSERTRDSERWGCVPKIHPVQCDGGPPGLCSRGVRRRGLKGSLKEPEGISEGAGSGGGSLKEPEGISEGAGSGVSEGAGRDLWWSRTGHGARGSPPPAVGGAAECASRLRWQFLRR